MRLCPPLPVLFQPLHSFVEPLASCMENHLEASASRQLAEAMSVFNNDFLAFEALRAHLNNVESFPHTSRSAYTPAFLDPEHSGAWSEEMASPESATHSTDLEDISDMSSDDSSDMSIDDYSEPSTDPAESMLELCSQPCCPVEEELHALSYALLARCNLKLHPSLTLPLWSPSHLYLGAVGYYTESTGEFVTLLNAYVPGVLPSGSRIPRISTNNGQFKLVFFTYHNKGDKLELELKPGRPIAYTFAKSAKYACIGDFDAARTWFRAYADIIVSEFGDEHHIQKQDLSLVTAILNAEDYALFVSHSHPRARLTFDVDPKRIRGRLWGSFNIDTFGTLEEARYRLRIAGKTSEVRHEDESEIDPLDGDTLMIARLGFRDGAEDPIPV